MTARATFRGQPLLVLVAMLGGWLALRVALWASPFELVRPLVEWPARPAGPLVASDGHEARRVDRAARLGSTPRMPRRRRFAPGAPLPSATPVDSIGGVVGPNLLLAAGLPQMQVPAAITAYLTALPPPPGVPRAAPDMAAALYPGERGARWSTDGWVMLRQDSAAPQLVAQPSYGRSQAGAVLRYQLAPGNGHRPQVYGRASAALAGPRERELAAGLAARPLSGVPLRAAAEARITETAGGTMVRPAVHVVTELAPRPLPLGARGEAYLQAGYVGGEGATAFVDGQARVERPVVRLDGAEIGAGAGTWGGAQKGAARLDVGPTASLGFRLGAGRGRIAADYRLRVAGDAAPANGAALTLSAGF